MMGRVFYLYINAVVSENPGVGFATCGDGRTRVAAYSTVFEFRNLRELKVGDCILY